MQVLKKNDFQNLEQLISMNQKQTKKTVSKFLRRKYPKVVETKDYIYAEGTIPVALVAHMDTVFEKDKYHRRNTLFYDVSKGVLWNPYGAGFDDKAGIFAILKIISDGYCPHVIFTTNEEKGGLGATELATKEPVCPFSEIKYIIELDRAGSVDCVFYDCDNPTFTNYVESFGFIEDWGTFSDIDVICPQWHVAGVNLSIGYEDEHSCSETLHINAFFKTIEKVKNMLNDAENAVRFEYIPGDNMQKYYSLYYDNYGEIGFMNYELVKCDKCKQSLNSYDAIPVKAKDGSTKFYCCDCLIDEGEKIKWCKVCGEAFEEDFPGADCCKSCREALKWNTTKSKKIFAK